MKPRNFDFQRPIRYSDVQNDRYRISETGGGGGGGRDLANAGLPQGNKTRRF